MEFLKSLDVQFDTLISIYIIRFLMAIASLVIGYLVLRLLIFLLNKVLDKLKIEETLRSFTKALMRMTAYIILFIIVLTIAGVPSSYFAGMLVGLGTAIGFGLRDEFKTVTNGIMILITKPYRVGDDIKVGDNLGKVVSIQLFHTVIKTYDNLNMVLNNGSLMSAAIVKLTENPVRRQDIFIDVSYDEDIRKVKEVLKKCLADNGLVLKDPAPVIALSSFEESSVRFMLRIWSRTPDFLAAKFSVNEEVKSAFLREGITIPYPQQDIHIKSTTSTIQ